MSMDLYLDLIGRANPAQDHWELCELLVELYEYLTNDVLEIGVHKGGTAQVWAEVLGPKVLVGVDSKNDVENDVSLLRLVVGKSQDSQTYAEVTLHSPKYDFLFIDGGHSYDEVLADWQLYSSLVRAGGVVALHDVCAASTDVPRFWNVLTEQHPTKTIRNGRSGPGIGIVYL